MLSLNLPQIPSWPLAIAAKAAGAQKGGPPCPKGRPQIGRDHAKIAPREQLREAQKSSIFRTLRREWAGISGPVVERRRKARTIPADAENRPGPIHSSVLTQATARRRRIIDGGEQPVLDAADQHPMLGRGDALDLGPFGVAHEGSPRCGLCRLIAPFEQIDELGSC